jgi:putative toxin-antitoxin system antitoxin component (TIGR02293 family)
MPSTTTSLSLSRSAQIARLLGGKAVLGPRCDNDLGLERRARQGFPVGVLQVLQDNAVLTQEDVFGWIIPRRTLSHRLKKHEPLSLDESNCVSRVARLFALAADTFGSEDRAREWLRKPLRRFAGSTPLAMLATDLGAHQVEVLLGRIAHGIAA